MIVWPCDLREITLIFFHVRSKGYSLRKEAEYPETLCTKDILTTANFFDLKEISENENLLFNVTIFKVTWGKCVHYSLHSSKRTVDLHGWMVVYTANDVLFVNIKQLISHSLKSLKDNSRDVESLNVRLNTLVQITIELTSKHV